MLKKDQARKKYPSDLTDEQWAIVEPLIPPAKQHPRGGRPRKVDMREVLQKLGQDMRYASAEIKGSCFEPKICLGDVMKSSKVAKLNGRKVWSISSK
jgi:Putative transposase of IS4/5 family (DUF4096)